MEQTEQARIESKLQVQCYLHDLRYALEHGARLDFQIDRVVDKNRELKYTNRYTMADLFPDEDPKEVLKRELKTLTVKEYLRTVKDIRFSNRSEMREFGKVYNGTAEVYIKIRVELLDTRYGGGHTTFVMSFHYAETPFSQEYFPYA